MPDLTLTETVTVSTRDITEEERYLAARYNKLVDKCITWAAQQMVYGAHATKLSLTKSVLASASRLAALDTKTQVEQHRVAFQSLLSEMTAIDAASSSTAPQPAIDQD